MIKEFKVPSPGESITEVEVTNWMVADCDYVNKNDELAEVESDKATLVLVAEESGRISIKVGIGQRIAVGTVAYTIDTEAQPQTNKVENTTPVKTQIVEETNEAIPDELVPIKVTPLATELMKENNLSVNEVLEGLRRISKQDVQLVIDSKNNKMAEPVYSQPTQKSFSRETEQSKMSMLRRRLSERLVAVKNETAMLTTFNEVDMGKLISLKNDFQNRVAEKHGIKPGFMGFFTKAVSIAAQKFPMVNSQIVGDEIVTPSYVDVGIAVQSPKGLMVPIVRNAESKTVIEIEREIKELAQKARDKKISIEELSGGTISITNGGVFGSLLSTPILNPPQSAILGMHNIVDRPVALNGQVVIRPMMYVALSYDHRIIDGKDSVGFLKTVKELVENPERLLFNGANVGEQLFDL